MISKKQPKVSVQVINWNGKKFLKECFDSLLKQDYSNFEAVLVDNASTDDSVGFISNNYKREIKSRKIRIIKLKKNYGFAGGYNRSYKMTDADYVLLLNNDTILPDRSLISELVERAETDGKIALVGAITLPVNMPLNSMKPIEKLGVSLLLTNVNQIPVEKGLLYASGCCVLIKKRLIDMPFDDDYFIYSEDVYLGWKSSLLGYKNVLEQKARLWHYGSGTNISGSPFIRYLDSKNRIMNCLIFYDSKNVIKIIPIALLYIAISSMFFLQKPKVLTASLKGYLWVLENLPSIIKKRKYMQGIRKVDDKEVLKLFSYRIFDANLKVSSYSSFLMEHKTLLKIISLGSRLLDALILLYCRIFDFRVYELSSEKDL